MRNGLIFLVLMSQVLWAGDINQNWNDPGVTVTEPNAFDNSGVLNTDTMGRSAPQTQSQSCVLKKICDEWGQCRWMRLCR